MCEGNYGYGGIHVYNRTHLVSIVAGSYHRQHCHSCFWFLTVDIAINAAMIIESILLSIMCLGSAHCIHRRRAVASFNTRTTALPMHHQSPCQYWEYYETGGPSPPVPPTPVPPALSPPSLLSAVPAAQEEEHTQGLEVHANTNTMRGDGENTVGVDRAQTAASTGSGKKTTKDHLWLIVNQHGPRPPLFLGA